MRRCVFLVLLFSLYIGLSSCDAVNRLQYSLQNKTEETIRVRIPNFPIEPEKGEFSTRLDTIIEIAPGQSLWIGSSPTDINFPWATKNIYKEAPGICGLELIAQGSLIKLDCSKASWKYKKRWSTLKIN